MDFSIDHQSINFVTGERAGFIAFDNHILVVGDQHGCTVLCNDLAGALTIKSVTYRGTDSKGGVVNDSSSVVSAVFTKLNGGAGQNRAILKGKLAAVAEVGSGGQRRIVKCYNAIRNSNDKLGSGRNNRILSAYIAGGVLTACRLGKSELVCAFYNGIYKIKCEW